MNLIWSHSFKAWIMIDLDHLLTVMFIFSVVQSSKGLCCFVVHSHELSNWCEFWDFESLSDPKLTSNDLFKLKLVIDFENEYKRQHFSFERPRLGKCLLCCTRDYGHVIKLPNNINWINIQFLLSISHWTLNIWNILLDDVPPKSFTDFYI